MGFDAIRGQERAKVILKNAIASGRLPAYLFAGPRGVGKRTTALTFARALNCERATLDCCDECPSCRRIATLTHPDVKLLFPFKALKPDASRKEEEEYAAELDALRPEYRLGTTAPLPEAKYVIPIDWIRELRKEMGFKPAAGRYRVVIILEAERMTSEAANAFLKTLEEPQAETVFVLTTTRLFKLPTTIRSRCQTVKFSRLAPELVVDFLKQRFGTEHADYTPAAAVAEGSIKSALQFMENPEEFLSPPAVEIFLNPPKTDSQVMLWLKRVQDESVLPFITSLIFLYRQTLALKLGLGMELNQYRADIQKKAARYSYDELVRMLGALLRTLRESEYNYNKRLFFFSLVISII